MKHLSQENFDQFLGDHFEPLESKVEVLEKDVKSLREDMNFEFQLVREDIRQLDEKIDDKFTTIINKIDGFLGKLDVNDAETAALHARVDRVEQHLGFAA